MDYVFKLAYRHGNGEVEGFAAIASGPKGAATIKRARAAAVAKARAKVSYTSHPFDPARLIESDKGLTADDRAMVKADWVLEGYP